ncbi:hypothetical protein [Alkalibacterium sp. 20]|uniref:hypothetical protein n=1 Tax=Alkalibacterium sp. 20 TaxID=1798803 RepID=UPI0015A5189D|nr:hypothetical protein [Alkalibacterium sp. 20]
MFNAFEKIFTVKEAETAEAVGSGGGARIIDTTHDCLHGKYGHDSAGVRIE